MFAKDQQPAPEQAELSTLNFPPLPADAPSLPSAERNRTAPKPRKPRKKALWLSMAGVALLAGGTFFGSTLPDPKASAAYQQLSGEKATLQSDYEHLNSRYDELYGSITDREATLATRNAELDASSAAVKAAEAAVKKREDAVTAAEKTKAANTISDGTWTVGKDITAGTYRATSDVGGSCYWGIYTSGSNGDDIIENDIPGGGRPSVVLTQGQDFKSSRCGTWEKQQ
ncbi:hypothetical protein ACQR35_04365 [Pseudarthrobacter sp. J1738]|uniref:hypothetical protein n=1 Tax=Pseudarthrobacter sp. J1738 TaxID=3420446 RepID=UPI003D29BD56